MRKKNYMEIPRAKIQQGVDMCKKNISVFLNTAEILLKSEYLDHAAINVEFAIEEFGKALMLKDEYEKRTASVQVAESVFRNHPRKSERAWKGDDPFALDSKFRMISEGGFERSDDGKQGFSRGFEQVINISHYIRIECAFVDWDVDENDWFLGHKEISEGRLRNLLEHIREKTTNLVLIP